MGIIRGTPTGDSFPEPPDPLKIRSGNWSFRDPGDDIADGATVYSGNFMQLMPDTPILVGKTITWRGGNLTNVRWDPNWVLEGSVNNYQVSRCSHLHPEWVERGLKPCAEDCKHRVGDKKQWVDTDEREYRAEKNSISPTKPLVRTVDSTDADGIVTQRLQKQVFVYEDTGVER